MPAAGARLRRPYRRKRCSAVPTSSSRSPQPSCSRRCVAWPGFNTTRRGGRGRGELVADAGRPQPGRDAGRRSPRRSRQARLDEDDQAAERVHDRPQAEAHARLRPDAAASPTTQEDHLISLELGGHPTDPRNLWPEPYPRASDVDREENRLNDLVCSGEISLAEAQRRESAMKHTEGRPRVHSRVETSLPVAERPRRPEWMKVRAPSADSRYFDVKKLHPRRRASTRSARRRAARTSASAGAAAPRPSRSSATRARARAATATSTRAGPSTRRTRSSRCASRTPPRRWS